jgi:hypothetical protein
VNRSRRIGAPLFCDRLCSGLGRRSGKSVERRRTEKAAYDAQRRLDLADELKASKREYHKRTYDPVKAAAERKKRLPQHIEYCRRPEYRAWKRGYDRQYRAEKEYGEFSECFLLTQDIRAECLRQMSDYEIRMAKGTFGKSQQRKRSHERSQCKEPQVGPVGNLELRQGRKNGSLTSGFCGGAGSRDSSNDKYSTARFATSEATGCRGRNHVRKDLAARRTKNSAQDRGAS